VSKGSKPERARVALVQIGDVRNVRTNSGTPFFSKRAFEQHVGEVVDLSPAPVARLPHRALGKLASMATGRKAPWIFDPTLARRLGAYYTSLLRKGDYDIVFSPCSSSTLAYIDTTLPVVYFSDITWQLARNYYECYTDVLGPYDRAAERIERRAMERSSLVILPSHWSAENAVQGYGIDPKRVEVLYIGANLLDPPSRGSVLPRKLDRTIRLLLVGVDWEIKGGAIALDALRMLLERGVDAHLTVVGCAAPEGVSHERMTVLPFLNKQLPEERARFEALWRDADFFLLPTRFEAAGIVLCEAGAYGLPSLATATGGIPSLIRDGRNGYALPRRAEAFADAVMEIAANPEHYARLCETSRDEFEARLNWDVWGRSVAALLRERLPHLAERIGEER